MQFVYKEKAVELIDGEKRYHIPVEDVQRLLLRPGTRVLRFKKGEEICSIPFKRAVGEIEGFAMLRKHFS